MRPRLFLIFFFLSGYCTAQQPLITSQINRLADAGKVYGYIKYFHPWLQYKNINWDSAFAANVEGIINAKSKSEYANVMQKLFSCLNDNMTTVIDESQKEATYYLQPTTYQITDSILYININDVNDNTYGKLIEAYGRIREVKGIVFDMRKPQNSQFKYYITPGTLVDWTIMYSGLPLFFNDNILLPALRTVYHKASYETSFKQTSVSIVTGTSQKIIPAIFIVKNEDEVPFSAIGLQQKGLAAIIQDNERDLTLGKSISFYTHDSLIIKMRVAEAVNADGSLSVLHPDALITVSDNADSVIQLAKNLIKIGFKKLTDSVRVAPQAINKLEVPAKENYYPTVGYRMLAAAKIFGVIDNFFPAKNLMDKSWEESYRSAISKFIEARDSIGYLKAVAEMYSNTNDSHGFITYGPFSLKLNPIIQGRGNFIPPAITDVIENKVVVTRIYNDSVCRKAGIKQGDIILSIDGKDPIKLIEENRKYQSASTIANQNFFISKFLLFGNKDEIRKLKVQGGNGKIRVVNLPTIKEFNGDWHDDDYTLTIYSQHTKPSFKLLNKDVGYADLTSPLTNKDVDSMFTLFKNTKAIIFDDRGYPHFYADNLTKKVVKNLNAVLVKYTINVAVSPNIEEIGSLQKNFVETYTIDQSDNKDWSGSSIDSKEVYHGKIVMLINQAPQSAGDDIALKWKTACNAILIGSPTSGTDAGMNSFSIPGNITLYYSEEIGSFPDGKRVQRIGVLPDIYVRQTIKGVQHGKDEVLERAMKFLESGK